MITPQHEVNGETCGFPLLGENFLTESQVSEVSGAGVLELKELSDSEMTSGVMFEEAELDPLPALYVPETIPAVESGVALPPFSLAFRGLGSSYGALCLTEFANVYLEHIVSDVKLL